jgi:hypothetical protein
MNGHTRRWRVLLATLAILSMLAAACGGGDDPDEGGGGGNDEAAGDDGDEKVDAAQAEIDRLLPDNMKTVGISADTIEVGYLLNDSSNAEAAGIQGTELETAQARQQFWVDWVNANGGVAGRQIKVNWGKVHTIRPEESRPGCLQVTEDTRSFLVMAGTFFDPLCVTEEHETILFHGYDNGQATTDRSGGRLVQFPIASDRAMKNIVRLLHDSGELKGKTIGLLAYSQAAGLVARDATREQLTEDGYELAVETTLSGTDFAAGMAQIPIEVTKMKERGVDLVILTAPIIYSPPWTLEGEKQGWNPLYVHTPLIGGTSGGNYGAIAKNFDAIGYTTGDQADVAAGLPAPVTGLQTKCREIYKESTGEDFDPNSKDRDVRTEYAAKIGSCRNWLFLQEVAGQVEGELTTSSFLRTLAAFDNWDFYFRPPGSKWHPAKTGIINQMRRVEWANPCPTQDEVTVHGCWIATEQFKEIPL